MLATYNVNFAIAGDEPTMRALRELAADVVLLQETNEAWESALGPWIEREGLHARFWHSRDWPAGGAAIVSRWPLRSVRTAPSAVQWFDAQRAIVEGPCGAIEVVNVHLQPPVTRDGALVRGWFEAPTQHEREINALWSAIVRREDAIATIVAGDFNEPEDRGAVAWLARERRMTSAVAGFAPRATTWRWSVGPFTLEQRLDHVVYDPTQLRALDARVLRAGRSDHLPVRVEFAHRRRCAIPATIDR